MTNLLSKVAFILLANVIAFIIILIDDRFILDRLYGNFVLVGLLMTCVITSAIISLSFVFTKYFKGIYNALIFMVAALGLSYLLFQFPLRIFGYVLVALGISVLTLWKRIPEIYNS